MKYIFSRFHAIPPIRQNKQTLNQFNIESFSELRGVIFFLLIKILLNVKYTYIINVNLVRVKKLNLYKIAEKTNNFFVGLIVDFL